MIKHPGQVALMAESGRLLASVFQMLDTTELVGMSTLQVDALVEQFIVEVLKARPASKGQYGYGFVLNCSVNEEVCHGVPSSSRILQDGDIVNLDITLEKNGYIADSSKTYLIGNVSSDAQRYRYSVVREYCGHGIGQQMHEAPQVLHFGKPGTGLRLREGMVFTIEPMLNQGTSHVKTEADGWTVVTRDGALSAQFEHTVAVTASGVSVLTLRPDEASML